MQLNLSQAIGDYFDNVLSKEKESVDEESVIADYSKQTHSEFMRLFSGRKACKKPKKKTLSSDLNGSKK